MRLMLRHNAAYRWFYQHVSIRSVMRLMLRPYPLQAIDMTGYFAQLSTWLANFFDFAFLLPLIWP